MSQPLFRYSFSNGEFTLGEGGEWDPSQETLGEAIGKCGYSVMTGETKTAYGFMVQTHFWNRETTPMYEYAVRVGPSESPNLQKVILVKTFPDLLELLGSLYR
jgi:hypothetical protein